MNAIEQALLQAVHYVRGLTNAEPASEAEKLLDMARNCPPGLVRVDDCPESWHLERAILSLAFEKRSKSFQFRAMAEGWSLPRIIREMY